MKGINTLFATLMMLSIPLTALAKGGDSIVGVYEALGEKTGKLSHIEFYRQGDTYSARIIWLDTPHDECGEPLFDINNPNPELRNVRVDSVVLIWGVKYDEKHKMWRGGKVYDPQEGRVYDVQLSFDTPDILRVRGFVGTPMIGKDLIWYKLREAE